MKTAAVRAFRAAVRRADAGLALTDCLQKSGLPRPKGNGKTYVIAVGKAAPAMLRAVQAHLSGPRVMICVTHRENDEQAAGAEVFRAGHPVPDDIGAHAAQRVQEVLADTTEDDVVLALISGGGSALLPAPPPGVSLQDKQTLNRLLLKSGLDIEAVNAIRQHVSVLKGGGLLRAASPAPVSGFILSDVIGDNLQAIASGPTVSPIATRDEVRRLIARSGIEAALPETIRHHLQQPARPRALPEAVNHLIGCNGDSLVAADNDLRAKFATTVVEDPLVGDVNDAASRIRAAIKGYTPDKGPQAIIWGGETTVNVRGKGSGGRNQELALRVAALMDADPVAHDWVFLSAGTDGRDGPTDAAGAIVDQQTLQRIRKAGLSPAAQLENNDSYPALQASDDLLITGPTGTNVADVQILLQK